MDPEDQRADRGSPIDVLIARARFLDEQVRRRAGFAMPAPLVAQLSDASAVGATPAPWSGPSLVLLLIVAMGGALFWPTAGPADQAELGLTLSVLVVWLACGLGSASVGLLAGQGRTAGLRLAKWLPWASGVACVGQLMMLALGGANPPVLPAVAGLGASAAAWRLVNSPAFGGFVTYRLLLRQARLIRAGVCARTSHADR